MAGEPGSDVESLTLFEEDKEFVNQDDVKGQNYVNDEVILAKYIEGKVDLLRQGRVKRISASRSGMLVIDIQKGGQLYFYKKSPAYSNKKNGSPGEQKEQVSALLESTAAVQERRKYFGSSLLPKTLTREHKENTDLEKRKLARSKLAVFVGDQEYVEPPEMPYLHIPASVPWRFKSKTNMQNNTFQIVVPPTEDGKVDHRVQHLNTKNKFLNKMKNVWSPAGVLDENSVFEPDQLLPDSKNKPEHQGSLASTSLPDNDADSLIHDDFSVHSTISTVSESREISKATNSQRFTFSCRNSKELAVYARAAHKLDRMFVDNKYVTQSLMPKSNARVRSKEGMEVAAQTALIQKSKSSLNIPSRRLSSIGVEEFRCFPLNAYPYTWMTKKELADEMARSSKKIHDMSRGSADEIGTIQIEALECLELPKKDRLSATDAMCYFVCGPHAFVTDVIPDNLNPVWLPLSRRACIMPLYNAYSQAYISCFDYDGEKEMDDFIGRVVIDIPQLLPGYSYEVTLPLRETSQVYSRKHLGFIRLRLLLEWTKGDRAALLSYLPKKTSDITKRLKGPQPLTVTCPDAKSFYNIVHTIYGKDIPGKYNNNIRVATQREVALVNTMLVRGTKRILRNIIWWKNPLLSAYLFCGWMFCVVSNSVTYVPSFVLSWVLIFLLRNYVKYNVASASGLLYGHRTIGDMLRILFFDENFDSTLPSKKNNLSAIERFLLGFLGVSRESGQAERVWNYEDHAEFPFSTGLRYPKRTYDSDNSLVQKRSLQSNLITNIDGLDSVDLASDSDNGEYDVDSFDDDSEFGDDEQSRSPTKRVKGAQRILKNSFTSTLPDTRGQEQKKEIKRRRKGATSSQNEQVQISVFDNAVFDVENSVKKIADQSVNVKVKSTKSIKEEILKWNSRVQTANFHLFDDRIFIGDKRGDFEKILKLNSSRNPIMNKLAPLMSGITRIIHAELSAFRAVFNIFMWKDPMLSFWITFLVFIFAVVLLFFPWQKFFFAVGLVGLGPQNLLLAQRKEVKPSSQPQESSFEQSTKPFTQSKQQVNRSVIRRVGDNKSTDMTEDYDNLKETLLSPLLIRNGIQLNPDKNACKVIVPSAPFRFNRFYDWPPEPALTKIKKND